MNTLYGWYRRPNHDGRLGAVRAALAATDGAARVEARDDAGVLCVGSYTSTHYDPINGIMVGVAGAPRWRDPNGRESAATAEEIGARLRAHGASAIAAINGRFAIAVLDLTTAEAFLAVDRFASIPLYYFLPRDGGLIVSTRLSALAAAATPPLSVARQALYDYVYFHCVPGPGSIYNDVAKLEPATCVTMRSGRCSERAYWQPEFAASTAASADALAAELKSVLHSSVASGIHDGVCGSFLSGGLDSSTVAGLMGEHAPKNAGTFTMGFKHDDFDETKYARIAAEHFGLAMNVAYVEPADVARSIPLLSSTYDQPFGNASAIPTMLCAKFARERGVDILLAGDGGDEIFAGNERYLKQQVFERYSAVPLPVRRTLESHLVHGALPHKVKRYIEQANVPMPERTQTYNPVEWFTPARIFDPAFLRDVDTTLPRQRLRARYEASGARAVLDSTLYMDWKFTLADNDLVKVARACDAAGVAVTFPMLDNRLVDFSLKIPADLKLKPRQLRYFYKRAMRGYLPDATINKRKHGFGLPFGEWLRVSPELKELTQHRLRSLRARGFVRADFLDALPGLHESQHAGFFGTMLWVLIVLEDWLAAKQVAP
jgi:asparagine synthase (glutamine-hydrolysing)